MTVIMFIYRFIIKSTFRSAHFIRSRLKRREIESNLLNNFIAVKSRYATLKVAIANKISNQKISTLLFTIIYTKKKRLFNLLGTLNQF